MILDKYIYCAKTRGGNQVPWLHAHGGLTQVRFILPRIFNQKHLIVRLVLAVIFGALLLSYVSHWYEGYTVELRGVEIGNGYWALLNALAEKNGTAASLQCAEIRKLVKQSDLNRQFMSVQLDVADNQENGKVCMAELSVCNRSDLGHYGRKLAHHALTTLQSKQGIALRDVVDTNTSVCFRLMLRNISNGTTR